ncbi:MAG: hypothetical protein JNK23_04445 [Opitutaceae bacterium]|nr:hypothetical protein [Opitutaceae bacterium]
MVATSATGFAQPLLVREDSTAAKISVDRAGGLTALLVQNAAAEDDQQLTLRLIGQDTVIPKSGILSREKSPVSMMPEGLLKHCSNDEVRDLIAYLRTTQQVPLLQP